jgi:hypothetical protein
MDVISHTVTWCARHLVGLPQMLAWLNCYEALHPEVCPAQLYHLAVMHVNQDPR